MPLSLEELKQKRNLFKESKLFRGGRMDDRLRECTKCHEMKVSEDFDTEENICIDCVEEMEREEKAKAKNKQVKPAKPKKIAKTKKVIKYSCKCGETDPNKFLPKNKNKCKACIKIYKYEMDKKQALKCKEKVIKHLGERGPLSSKELMNCIKKTKPQTNAICNVLEDMGYLESYTEKRIKYFKLADKPKGEYNGLSEVLEEHKTPKNVLDEGVVNSLKQKEAEENLKAEVEGENERLELKIGVGESQEERIVNEAKSKRVEPVTAYINPIPSIIGDIYPHAEEIIITPRTNEIHIKLKG
jgi:DNA-binding MarR family transcriptional regulator